MKRILLIIFTLISINAFSQLQVKEGSFKYVPGGVIDNKEEYTDGNDLPMALIKISTENIPEQERMRLVFVGNRATQIIKKPRTGSMWIYISADAATFIDIRHPDYGTYKYYLPEELCDYCVYEMVLQYVGMQNASEQNYLIVKSDQANAKIYIDEEYIGNQFAHRQFLVGSTHTWKIECDLYRTESGSVTITNEENVIDITMLPEFGYLNVTTAPENGAQVYINDNMVGTTPYKSDKLSIGNYTVKVVKDQFKTTEQNVVVKDKETSDVNIKMLSVFVNVTIRTDLNSYIYVDGKQKSKGSWTGKIQEGTHIFEARKENHRTIQKTMEIVAGNNQTIKLDAPEAINGSLEISSNPSGADIYVDGKHCGKTPNYISEILIGKHELELTKQGCASVTKTITIKEGETLSVNEKLQTGKEINISTDQSGDKIYVDGNYLGISPITTNLSYENHEIKAERNGKTVSKNIEVSQVEAHGRVSSDKYELTFFGNQTFTVNGVSFTMIAVEGGTFKMGATSEQGRDADNDEKPAHKVTLSDYYIGETEVTQELWEAVMGNNPSYYSGYSQRPVEKVSWNDCQEFITKLNNLTGKNFRLPTEAEWEYAARGGNKSQGYKYSGSNNIGNVAWYYSNSSSGTQGVKTKHANELGIYDMIGNVWEWCQDWHDRKYYQNSSQTNPTGPMFGSFRVLRGGSWYDSARYCRLSDRRGSFPDDRYYYLGLRLALSQY
ncbi:MAG: SUMF1/EgtB/PvdO family nonheme iron enzyme [Bacteroidales bacterium]|nr:SUMF1/EgtB/PvdO family nonheme iron enzyme [Bacteroidales bacterium]